MKNVIKYLILINIYILAFIFWTHSTLKKGGKEDTEALEENTKS